MSKDGNIIVVADIRGNDINGRITGHIIPVARNYQEILSSVANVKIAAGPAILNTFAKDECLVLPYNVCSETIIDKLKIFVNFIVLLWKAKGNTIVLQQASVVTSFISIILFFWWSSPLFLVQYNTDAVNSKFKRFINSLAKLKITGTLCPSDRVGNAYGTNYCVVPDYFYTKKTKILPREDRKWDIGIIGGITANKGVVEAAEYLKNKDVSVLIAGRICEPELEEPLRRIASNSSNINLRIGFLSEDEYIEYIHTSKYCFLNYKGTYFDRSSGVVLDVLYNGTPVIGTKCEALKLVEKAGVGYVYNNIQNLDLEQLFDTDQYNSYLNAIQVFLYQQDVAATKFIQFIGL